jgi:transposase
VPTGLIEEDDALGAVGNSIAELYWREGINQNLYYRWSKDFPEAGKKRLAGDTVREATSEEV